MFSPYVQVHNTYLMYTIRTLCTGTQYHSPAAGALHLDNMAGQAASAGQPSNRQEDGSGGSPRRLATLSASLPQPHMGSTHEQQDDEGPAGESWHVQPCASCTMPSYALACVITFASCWSPAFTAALLMALLQVHLQCTAQVASQWGQRLGREW